MADFPQANGGASGGDQQQHPPTSSEPTNIPPSDDLYFQQQQQQQPQQSHPSAHAETTDSASEISAAQAAVAPTASSDATSGSLNALPAKEPTPLPVSYSGPGHQFDVDNQAATGLASAPVPAAAAPAESPQSGVTPAASDLLPASSSTQAPAAIASENAPGTANPFEPQEEASLGAPAAGPADEPLPAAPAPHTSSDSTAAAPPALDASTAIPDARPSAEAVAPSQEAVISPVEVKGETVEAPIDTMMQEGAPQAGIAATSGPVGEPVPVAAPVQALQQQPNGSSVQHAGEGLNGSAPAVNGDAVMDELKQESIATTTAPPATPAVDAAPSSSADALGSDDSNEPPAKRQRTDLPDVASAPAFAPSADASSQQQPQSVASSSSTAVAPQTSSPAASVPLDASRISMTPGQIKFAQNSIKSLKQRPEALAFQRPVDPDALGIPHYRNIIQHPMDLGTIDVKLAITASAAKGGKPTEKTKAAPQWNLDVSRDFYATVEQWEADVKLVFANCLQFNGPDHPVSQSAKTLAGVFEKQLKSLPVELPPPAQSEPMIDDKKARRPSNPVPTIRRSSSDVSGRPKREIHPPAPRDLPYNEEPLSSGSGIKKKRSNKPMTAKQQAYHAKVNQDELKFGLKIIDELFKPIHSALAWVFYDLPSKDLDFAPAYYEMIKRPVSLTHIQDKLRRREYLDKSDFVADVRLLFNNCYTFNPPDSDVYQMGRKLESVFNDRLSQMPKPKPMTPEPEDDYEDDVDMAEPDETLAKIRALEAQLAEMKREAKQGGSGSGSSAAKKKPSAAKPRASGEKKKSSKPKASGSLGEPTPKKAKKASGGEGSDDEDPDEVRQVTYQQKEELARKITQLSDERLDGALQIISEDKPASANDDEEIELDIDDLSPRTLYKLYRYVVKPKRRPGPKPGTAKGKSSKSGSGGKKRKNLDEEEEAARIIRLQEQLQSFDRAPESSAAAGASSSGQGVGGHDDLLQSESSEEESDGSESDY